jgi:release factor glutamine methyltransferase
MTVAELRRELAALIKGTSQTAALDARLIVAHALGVSGERAIALDDVPVDEALADAARALARRRGTGEPVARILCEKEFYGLPFRLAAETLVPRPDTETLVDAVVADHRRDVAITILDLGTGSGAILIALLRELPRATGVGIDKAENAVATARGNAERNGVGERARFAQGDWAAGLSGPFDVVVSNPPYIPSGEIPSLPVEVRNHDPHLALDGGDDGLDTIRTILSDLDRVLAANGRAYVEIGFGQAAEVSHIAQTVGFAAAFRQDLAGIDRVAVLRRERTTESRAEDLGRPAVG